ncbi:MAG: 8-amino-7-oxononanoate synthase [Gammaproteobacteria bacterium]
MQAALARRLQHALTERDTTHGRREVYSRQGAPQRATLNGKPLINFSSNDYLGLAGDPRLIEAAQTAVEQFGVGAGASAAVSGYTIAHEELEQTLAAFTRCESALLFSTGYMANLAVVSALATRGQDVFEDRLNHASLLDAVAMSRARLHRYPHADLQALAKMLADKQCDNALVITDGVFSMDGDVAPIRELVEICKHTGAALIVDDAHGLGVIGSTGRGSFEYCTVDVSAADALVGTFGKAFGVAGAFVAGDKLLIESLRQFARPHIYTTAMPPAQAATISASLAIVSRDSALRSKLHENIAYFEQRAAALGLSITPTITPIKPMLVGDNGEVLRIAETLRQRGYWVGAIRPPTVPAGTTRLRITLSAAHTHEHIDGLLSELRALI